MDPPIAPLPFLIFARGSSAKAVPGGQNARLSVPFMARGCTLAQMRRAIDMHTALAHVCGKLPLTQHPHLRWQLYRCLET